MSPVFYVVYQALLGLSKMTGFTYAEINIIVYFLIIPVIFFGLIDKILRKPVCLVLFAIFAGIAFWRIPNFEAFSEELFERCVDFLLGFSAIGMGYDFASVVICVWIPTFTFLVLAYFAFPEFSRKHVPTIGAMFARRK